METAWRVLRNTCFSKREILVFLREKTGKRYRYWKTTAVAKYYGLERRTIFSTEGSFGNKWFHFHAATPPKPRIPDWGFSSATRSWMEILTKGNLLSGDKNCSHCNFQGFHALSKENKDDSLHDAFACPTKYKTKRQPWRFRRFGSSGRDGYLLKLNPLSEFLTKDFLLSASRSPMEILTKKDLVGAKNCSHCISQDFHSLCRENRVSLVRTFLSDPDSESKTADLGVGVEKWSAKKLKKHGLSRIQERSSETFFAGHSHGSSEPMFWHHRLSLFSWPQGSPHAERDRCTPLELNPSRSSHILSDPTEIPSLLRDRCSNTPVALCFLWHRRLSLLHPHLFQ